VETSTVECLSCGKARGAQDAAAECPRCGYVGWAPSSKLTEPVRRALRERPLERRRSALRIAA
jgi:hypothetical protein